jgi:hypothetical protein
MSYSDSDIAVVANDIFAIASPSQNWKVNLYRSSKYLPTFIQSLITIQYATRH